NLGHSEGARLSALRVRSRASTGGPIDHAGGDATLCEEAAEPPRRSDSPGIASLRPLDLAARAARWAGATTSEPSPFLPGWRHSRHSLRDLWSLLTQARPTGSSPRRLHCH